MQKKSSISVPNNEGGKEFIYCDTKNCPYKHCIRRITNAPFDEIVSVRRFEIDKSGKCKGNLQIKELKE